MSVLFLSSTSVCVCVETWVCVCAQLLSRVQLFATPWTAAHQAPLNFSFHSDFPGFYTNFLLLVKDSTKEATLSLVITSPESHWSVTISGSFLIFHHLDSFGEYWSEMM